MLRLRRTLRTGRGSLCGVASQSQRSQARGLFTDRLHLGLVLGDRLLALSQLLFLFLESRFGAVKRPFSVGVQSRYSFSREPGRRTDFPA